MVYRYNLYNLEALFREYLLSGIKKDRPFHKNTIKNYLSDLRHFLGWYNHSIKNAHDFFSLSPSHIASYKDYLITNNLPIRTINRRLSTLRKFCFFCTEAKILQRNPSKDIHNISQEKTQQAKTPHLTSLINHFQHDLASEGLSHDLIDDCIYDVKKFFSETTHYG